MKGFICMLLTAVFAFSLVACGEEEEGQFPGILYGDFSMGDVASEDNGLIVSKEISFKEKPTVDAVIEELSDWTGLSFEINEFTEEGGNVYIDWSEKSNLISGLGNTKTTEEFQFEDDDSMRWFMMDSLKMTLEANKVVENELYYTTNGGENLVFDDLSPVSEFPSDIPYMGSGFYFAHADGKGDMLDFSSVEGTWHLYGADDTATIYLNADGLFTACYADGAVEAEGYIVYDDVDDCYYMYTEDGELFESFYMDSETQFHIGNDDTKIYILDGATEEHEHGTLIPKVRFTGLTQIENDNEFGNGYYYEDETEDGNTRIINACAENEFLGGETTEEKIGIFVDYTSSFTIDNLTIEETTFGSYPAYNLSWSTGENEDTTLWLGRIIETDNYSYLYCFGTDADYMEGSMEDMWQESLDGLDLVYPDEE